MSIKFEGFEKALKFFDELADTKEQKQTMGKACAVVEAAAKKNAPKGNGELRRSIESKVEFLGGDLVGVVSTPLEYAPYVEYGTGLFAENGDGRKEVPWVYQDDEGKYHSTRGQKPHPFLRPALNDNREQVKKILIKGGFNID